MKRKMSRAIRWLLVASLAISHRADAQSLKEIQDAFPRVRAARNTHESSVKELFLRHRLAYPPAEIFLRAFKKEGLLELWARNPDVSTFQLVKSFPICSLSGQLGPKREEADEQIPEGFYYLTALNPESHYHLSLRVSYPNGVDQLLGTKGRLGGDIFIHGGCETVGCIPLTNSGIAELYVIVVDVLSSGNTSVPVNIFPTRLTERNMRWLERVYQLRPALVAFWRNLKAGMDFFEMTRRPPLVVTGMDGVYRFY